MNIRPLLICAAALLGGCSTTETPSNNAKLENTYWKLMTLGGENLKSPKGAREIQFMLTAETHRVTGFSGCNNMMGAYTVDQNKIVFSNMGGTRMFCENTMDIEKRVHEMFSNATAWRISGKSLELIDSYGRPIATFESRDMK
jgi:heat shock protein HslJ